MDRPAFLKSVIDWLRAGYPNGVPQGDYIPLVALLRRQLTEDEVQAVAVSLTKAPSDQITKIDAGVEITKITEELPAESDVSRVRAVLEGAGWPFNDHPLGPPPPDPDPGSDADPDE